MFKLTKNGGLRRSAGSRSQPRVGGIPTGIGGAPIALHQHRRPAFLPDTPQEQGWDSSTPRVNETA